MKKLIVGLGIFAFLFIGMARASFSYTNNSGYRQRLIFAETEYDQVGFVDNLFYYKMLYPGESMTRNDYTPTFAPFGHYIVVSFDSVETLVGQQISLQASSGQNVCAEGGGGLGIVANRGGAGPWEIFVFQDANGGNIESGDQGYLRTDNGNFFTAQNGGGSTLKSDRFYGSTWELFKIWKLDGGGNIVGGTINSGDSVAVTSVNNFFCAAEGGGGREVNANRFSIGAWEKFTITLH